MADYKKMYYIMFNAVTDADRLLQNASCILQEAQSECEDMYLRTESAIHLEEECFESKA